MDALFTEGCNLYGIDCRKQTFDSDHVHMILDMGLHSKPEIAKKLKGYVAKKLFQFLPWLKKRYFGKSGLNNLYKSISMPLEYGR